MSNRRPPKAFAPSPLTADDRDRPDEDVTDSRSSADAASLGFADLAEHPPTPELPAFRDLRARLFGDIDLDAPPIEADDRRPASQPAEKPSDEAAPTPFIPAQASIANGALTAAEIAAEDDVEDHPETEPVDVIDDLPGPMKPTDDEEAAAAQLDLDLAAGPVIAEPAPTQEPASQDPAPEPEPGLVALPTQQWPVRSTAVVDEPTRRRAALWVVMASFVVVALISGWLLLNRNNDQGAATPGVGAPSEDTRAQSTTTGRIDGESVRASEQLEFDSAVDSITIQVPRPAPGSVTADFDVQITDLEIVAAGQPGQPVSGTLSAGDTVSIDLDHPSDSLSINYVADGAVVRTEPSSAHRAKALVTPLQVETGAGSNQSVTVRGADILNLGCAEQDTTVACGEQSAASWAVTPPSPDTIVIAQVDLPR